MSDLRSVTTRLTTPGHEPCTEATKGAGQRKGGREERSKRGRTDLDHDPVVLDDAVADKAADRGDGLVGDVELGRGRRLVAGLADAVDLLVELGAVVVTVLTGAGDRVHDLGRVPGTDASNLAETLVGLARELLGTPTVRHTLETVTLGDGDDVDVLVLLEDGRDVERLLKVRLGELDLVGDGATVDLCSGFEVAGSAPATTRAAASKRDAPGSP